jgi:hypothetical protein
MHNKGSHAMQNIPVVTPDLAAIFTDTRKNVGEGKIFAYVPFQGRHSSDYWSIGVATLGESGYSPAPVNIHFPTYDQASEFCEDLRRHIGFDADTATAIVMDTMRRSEFKREQESDTVTVKINAEQLEHAIEALDEFDDRGDTDVRDILQDAKDELDERLESSPTFAR